MESRNLTKTALALLLAIAVLAPSAAAEGVDHGRTSIKLSRDLYKQLSLGHGSVGARSPARSRGRLVVLPISSGLIESTYGSGYLFLDGEYVLRARKRKLRLTDLVLNTAKKILRARVGGRPVTIATIPGERVTNPGFATRIAENLVLTRRGARLLGRRLGLPRVFRRGRVLARAVTVAHPQTVAVSGGTIDLTFDPGFLAKLDSLGVALGSAETAMLSGASPPVLTTPVRPGPGISLDLTGGNLGSEGGFALLQDGAPPRSGLLIGIGLDLESNRLSATIDLGPELYGGSPRLAGVDFAGAAPAIDYDTRTITAPGRIAALDPGVAAALNEAFAAPKGKADVFVAGETLGYVSFVAQAG